MKHHKIRHLHRRIWLYTNSNTTQRRIAQLLNISRTTVGRKIKFLNSMSEEMREKYLLGLRETPLDVVYLDEMRSYIHTRCRPVSIALVTSKKRKILAIRVVPSTPNSPRLTEIAKNKYGYVLDQRHQGITTVLKKILPILGRNATIITDEDLLYPGLIRNELPGVNHLRYKSKKATIAGHGEMKEGGLDPLFPINHTNAMIRANVSRLVRRTWCTSKTLEALQENLNIYADYHNRVLTPAE